MTEDIENSDDACVQESADVDRREVVVGAAASIAAFGAGGQAAASTGPEEMFVQAGDRIMLIKGTSSGKLLRPELLDLRGRQIEAFPFDPNAKVERRKNRLNRLVLLRLDPDDMDEKTREYSVEGVLAYSAICTHRGCTIKSWMKEKQHLRCHCHLSEFAALSFGRVERGPAKRSLPMVPLKIDSEGYVIAAGGFSARAGPDKK